MAANLIFFYEHLNKPFLPCLQFNHAITTSIFKGFIYKARYTVPKNTVFTPKNTVFTPKNTVFTPNNTGFTPNNTGFTPNTVFTPNNTVFTPKNLVRTFCWNHFMASSLVMR